MCLLLKSRRIFIACIEVVLTHVFLDNLIAQLIEMLDFFERRLAGTIPKCFSHLFYIRLAQHIIKISTMLLETSYLFQNIFPLSRREKTVGYIDFFLREYFLYGTLFFIQPLFFQLRTA